MNYLLRVLQATAILVGVFLILGIALDKKETETAVYVFFIFVIFIAFYAAYEIEKKIKGQKESSNEPESDSKSVESFRNNGKINLLLRSDSKVDTIINKFKSVGLNIRIYQSVNNGRGSKLAVGNSKLSEISEVTRFGNVEINPNMTVLEVEEMFKSEFGLGVQMMTPDGNTFANNNIKLAGLL
jgi:preprotein translocase subunit SecG